MLSPCGDGPVSACLSLLAPQGQAHLWEEQAWHVWGLLGGPGPAQVPLPASAGAHRPSSPPPSSSLAPSPTDHQNLPRTQGTRGCRHHFPGDPQAVPTSLTPEGLFGGPCLPSSGVPELEAEGRAGPLWPHSAVSAVRLSPGSGCTLGRPSSSPQDQPWPQRAPAPNPTMVPTQFILWRNRQDTAPPCPEPTWGLLSLHYPVSCPGG